MANRTVKDAKSIRGTNPQHLVEKIIRSRIYDSRYWKEECFALTAELLVDKAIELRFVGGVFGGNIQPTPFLCLILKMLQIQPEKDIIIEFIKNEEFKYVRALGAYYMRLTGSSLDCYKYLEPLLNDYRKLRYQNRNGEFQLLTMDDFIDQILREERLLDVILPRIQKRHVLEENNELESRICVLDEDLEDGAESSEEEEEIAPAKPREQGGRGGLENERGIRRRSPSPLMRNRRGPERPREMDRQHRADRGGGHDERGGRDRAERGNKRHRSRSGERRKRSRSRSVSPSGRHRGAREMEHRRAAKSGESRPHHRSDRDRGERDRGGRHRTDKRDRDSRKDSSADQEVAEANALRAKLGLPPLRN
ncbi:hypothetical protein B566_EDAN014407 [Ephemera danica]|nr:hypothetical protein B566_EDAN014407 [Ephemera danica]